MAGDWIKMRVALPDDSDVMRMADELQIDEFSVCGRLLAVWGWADENTADGFIASGTAGRIDKKAGINGFANAMEHVGWIRFRDNGVEFIGWEVHNSKSAKSRAQDAKRKQLERRNGKKDDEPSEICPVENRTENGHGDGHLSGSQPDTVFSSLLSPSVIPPKEEERGTALESSLTAHQVLVTEWNVVGPVRCHRLTSKRRSMMTARLRDAWWRENWRDGLARVPLSDFLCGRTGGSWKADIEWFLQPDSLTKIIEGKYENGTGNSKRTGGPVIGPADRYEPGRAITAADFERP